jgi:glycosyltransferase involved in cell wall biosynthesis
VSAVATSAPATFVYVQGRGDTTWRADWPAAAIGARTVAIPEGEVNEALLGPNDSTAFPWSLELRSADGGATTRFTDSAAFDRFIASRPRINRTGWEFPAVQGAAVFTRPCLARATLAKAMRRQGTVTVGETDDNYFAPNRQNIVLRETGYGEKGFDLHAKAMASMDRNVFSTAWLRDRYRREYRRRFGDDATLPEPFVCRNCVPDHAWPDLEDYDGPLRVGFMGSVSHLWDVHVAYAAFHAAKYVGARTVMIGYNPADPDPGVDNPNRSEKSLAVSRKWDAVIDVAIPWIDPGVYHRAPLPLDIGLAPLRKNDFTLGKSDSKLLEFTISGAVSVCQRHPVFERAGWIDGVNTLMADNQEQMGLATLRLLRDPPLRRELLEAAQELVRNERNESVMRREWLDAVT